ncbi:MAG: hypothetical protein AB4063_19710 [Crocosphaera sp.]
MILTDESHITKSDINPDWSIRCDLINEFWETTLINPYGEVIRIDWDRFTDLTSAVIVAELTIRMECQGWLIEAISLACEGLSPLQS